MEDFNIEEIDREDTISDIKNGSKNTLTVIIKRYSELITSSISYYESIQIADCNVFKSSLKTQKY